MKKASNYIAVIIGLCLFPLATFAQGNSGVDKQQKSKSKKQIELKTESISNNSESASPVYSGIQSDRESARVFSKQEARVQEYKAESSPILMSPEGQIIKSRNENNKD